MWVFMAFAFLPKITAQSLLDVSIGSSTQDRFMSTVSYRYQVNDKFRVGLEAQYGAPKYRFVDAKPITEGYAATFSVPLTVRLYEKEAIRLDFFGRAGFRTQGVIDPDKNDARDSIKRATAILFEPGLIVTLKTHEKVNLQSGIAFPIAYQNAPSALFESAHIPLIYAGLNVKSSEKRSFFIKSLFGAAVGGNGDTYKFSWSVQGGLRFNFGKRPVSNVLEPSF